MSWFKKIAWLAGNALPSDLPETTTVAELLDMSYDDRPFSIANSDEISVILVPNGDNGQLLVMTADFLDAIAGKQVSLEMSLRDLSIMASKAARDWTRQIALETEQII